MVPQFETGNGMNWHSASAAEVLNQLDVTKNQGLTSKAAVERQKKYGKTSWRKKKPKAFSSGFRAIFRFYGDRAADRGGNFLLHRQNQRRRRLYRLYHYPGDRDYQRHHRRGPGKQAEKAIAALKKLSAPHAKVIRGGKTAEVASRTWFPGTSSCWRLGISSPPTPGS